MHPKGRRIVQIDLAIGKPIRGSPLRFFKIELLK